MPASNDDHIEQPQDQYVALHARYLLALKAHRRDGLILGFFYGCLASWSFWYLAPKVIGVLGRL